MIRLGILTMMPLESHSYFDEMAKRTKEYNIILYLFSPLSVEPSTQMIEGYRYENSNNSWKSERFAIPEYLYDRCFYGEDRKSAEAQSVVSWLKSKKNIHFLGYGLPNKWRLYETLIKEPAISPYLPSTNKAANAEKILAELHKHNEIILKPINGAHGFAVYSLKKMDKKIKIRTTKQGTIIEKIFDDTKSVSHWLENLLTRQIFLIQPRLNNLNSKKEPFDLRIFLQKDKQGIWKEKGRAIRCGKKHGLLTNISAGANVISYSKWRESTPYFNHDYINQELDDILRILPEILEEKFHPLFELGIDIIIASDQSLWILDMNSKPGRKIINLTEPQQLDTLYSAPLVYCSYLAAQSKDAVSN
ncbi:YheC/YheD family protein [Heyndrickxia sp. NPDC080065]|uniref:YheC/YheD family endospore coat-associated protein n=1 Tax=Heyndrickxia sp. NPDC080065 TaxID=3390568 RepID=UPI003D020310